MASVGNQLLTILSKNPVHVAYVKTWIKKYSGQNLSEAILNDYFATLYNWYYYYIHDCGMPFPVVAPNGAFDATTVKLRDLLVGSSGIVASVVNQFLYAIYTGYTQAKLSAEFAFPRDFKSVTTPTTNQTTTTEKKTTPPTVTAIKTAANVLRYIPSNWTEQAEKKNNGSILTYAILAAIAGGVFIIARRKGR